MSKQIVNAHPILKANLSTIPQSIVKSKNLPKSSTTKKRVSHTIQVSDEFYSKTLTSQNYTLETALSELIDNSIDAKAKDIIINYPKKSTFDIKKSTITIFDNGNGMSKDELINSMTMGTDRQYDNKEIGYFGVGMKSALAYLSESVHIKTKKFKENFYTQLDWNIKKTFDTLPPEKTRNIHSRGTTITITPGKRYEYYSHNQESALLSKIGVRYYHLLCNKKINITINGIKVKAIDPMYRKHKNTIALSNVKIVYDKENTIKMCGYYLSKIDFDDFTDFDIYKRHFAIDKGLPSNKAGVYVLYNNKYINLGDTFLGYKKSHSNYNNLRIELVMPKIATELFGVSMNKNAISDFLCDETPTGIKKLMRNAIADIIRRFNEETRKRKSIEPIDIDSLEKISKITKKVNNSMISNGLTNNSYLNEKCVADRVEIYKDETIKDVTIKGVKQKSKNKKQTKNTQNTKQNKIYTIKLHKGGDIGDFWYLNRIGKTVVMNFNQDHKFYKNYMLNRSESEMINLHILLYSLACAQLESYSYFNNGEIDEMWRRYWNTASFNINIAMKTM